MRDSMHKRQSSLALEGLTLQPSTLLQLYMYEVWQPTFAYKVIDLIYFYKCCTKTFVEPRLVVEL